MSALVPIPWQPSYYLTPDTLALLVAAGAHLGVELRVTDAWRSYAEQAALYKAYREGRGAIASNPDTGQRNHMRGGAFDLARTDPAAQAACRAVGLTRDPDEPWHWNNPRWELMPIIPTNPAQTAAAGGAATPITERTDDDEMLTKEAQDFITNTVAAVVDSHANAITAAIDARIGVAEQRNRRESRPARVYKRADGSLWIAGPTVVPRPVAADTATRHDRDILKGDSLLVDAGDFTSPQPISDEAWKVLEEEHARFRDYLAGRL